MFIMIGVSVAGKPTGLGDGSLTVEAVADGGGNTYMVAMKLLTDFIWPFELASVLILLAIVAAVVIAKKDHKDQPA
jgi:NADH:ubiquinone oxidoreductase subunit 6 (subunit J)